MIGYLSFRNAKIRYSDTGSGRAIILLHGYPENLHIWDAFARKLSVRFRVIAIDLPGFGKSESIGYIHTMELMAECVHTIMNRLQFKRYIIVGHSMGGYVAMAFAELFPQCLRGLCMIHSTAAPDTEAKKGERDNAIALIKQNKGQYINSFADNLFADPKSCPANYRKILLSANPRAMVATLKGMRLRPNREMVLRFQKYPVLYIIGKKDKLFDWVTLLAQSEIPPVHDALLLENAGHSGFYEAKQECLDKLRRFATRCFREKSIRN